jgi:hypothetical protein
MNILLSFNFCYNLEDVVERSIRDVLDIVPDEFKPYENGALVRLKPYEPYVSHNVSLVLIQYLVARTTSFDINEKSHFFREKAMRMGWVLIMSTKKHCPKCA